MQPLTFELLGQSENQNNQPVVIPACVGIHNGIITNHAQLWSDNSDLINYCEN